MQDIQDDIRDHDHPTGKMSPYNLLPEWPQFAAAPRCTPSWTVRAVTWLQIPDIRMYQVLLFPLVIR
jgi:hypothetical protein